MKLMAPGHQMLRIIRLFLICFFLLVMQSRFVWAAVPNPPSNLTASSVSYSSVILAWTDNSSDESGFKIERKTGASGTYSTIYTTSANATSYTNTGLTQGIEYYYRVRAYNGSNYSSYSNEISATTLTTVSAPSNLAAVPLSTTQIKLTWTDNTSDETYFYIEYKTGTAANYTSLASVAANITTYTHNNLTANTTYYYRVRAYNNTGYSSYSNEANVATLSCIEEGYYQP